MYAYYVIFSSKTLKRISELMERSEFSEKDIQEMEQLKKKTEDSGQ